MPGILARRFSCWGCNGDGESDKRWRLTIFLPVGVDAEEQAAAEVGVWLRTEFGDFTMSRARNGVYEGYWRDDAGIVHSDRIALALVDLQVDRSTLDEVVKLVRAKLHECYMEAGRPQKAVWVTGELLELGGTEGDGWNLAP